MTNSAQPCFLAYASADLTNISGDGTAYTVLFNTVVFDQASNYTAGTGTFTAPVTGRYFFNCNFNVNVGVTTTTAMYAFIKCTSRKQLAFNLPTRNNVIGFFGVNADIGGNMSGIFDMTAGDTCIIEFHADGGAKTTSLRGGADLNTCFSGHLIC
jgi:hypothetical protein